MRKHANWSGNYMGRQNPVITSFPWHFQDIKTRRFTRQNKCYVPGSPRNDSLYALHAHWGRLPQLMKSDVIYFMENSIRISMLNIWFGVSDSSNIPTQKEDSSHHAHFLLLNHSNSMSIMLVSSVPSNYQFHHLVAVLLEKQNNQLLSLQVTYGIKDTLCQCETLHSLIFLMVCP